MSFWKAVWFNAYDIVPAITAIEVFCLIMAGAILY